MNKNSLKGNLSLLVARSLAGADNNVLKYMVPLWLGAITGTGLRCIFAAVAFWITGLFVREATPTWKQRIQWLATGALCMYTYLVFFLKGLSYTTPISSAIFSSTQPIWVFIIAMLFYHERVTLLKIIGIIVGFGGALLCILSTRHPENAVNPVLGDLFCLISAITFAIYLTLNKEFLKTMGNITVMKYLFTGASITAIIVSLCTGFDAPVITDTFHGEWHLTPWLLLLFVLVFPTYISYVLISIGLKYIKATVAALYGYCLLIVTTIISYIAGQDTFTWTQPVAIVMMCASIYMVEIADNKKQISPTPKS
ncbi:MAG: DMT family transporter [Marinifilaceae bacterium]